MGMTMRDTAMPHTKVEAVNSCPRSVGLPAWESETWKMGIHPNHTDIHRAMPMVRPWRK